LVRRGLRVAREWGLRYLIKYVLALIDYRTGLVSLVLTPYIAWRVRRLDVVGALNLLFSDSLLGMLFRPMQIKEEIHEFLRIAEKLRPRYILEIGTAHGGTLLLLTRVASDDATIVSIDLPGGPFGGGYPWLRTLIYKLFKRGKQRIVLIRGDSHSEETFRKVLDILNGNKLDLLFIDGDHTYDGVKKDYEVYSRLVRKGGVIAFHDIVPGPQHLVGGVPRFWLQLKKSLTESTYLEVVKDWNQRGWGIGIILYQRNVKNG
jgi:predicted O-methyltransferase YrrM